VSGFVGGKVCLPGLVEDSNSYAEANPWVQTSDANDSERRRLLKGPTSTPIPWHQVLQVQCQQGETDQLEYPDEPGLAQEGYAQQL